MRLCHNRDQPSEKSAAGISIRQRSFYECIFSKLFWKSYYFCLGAGTDGGPLVPLVRFGPFGPLGEGGVGGTGTGCGVDGGPY